MKPNIIKVIQRPDMDLYPAIIVDKDTVLNYENESVKQSIKDLVYNSTATIKKDNYESTYITKVYLKEGDILIFEEENRGYIVPVEKFEKVEDAIKELEPLREV